VEDRADKADRPPGMEMVVPSARARGDRVLVFDPSQACPGEVALAAFDGSDAPPQGRAFNIHHPFCMHSEFAHLLANGHDEGLQLSAIVDGILLPTELSCSPRVWRCHYLPLLAC